MIILTPIFNAYVRWRHSRGFGVHSPFAYNLVKMAVSPGADYAYYGYTAIDRVILAPGFRGYPHSRSDARLLLRFLVQLGSRRLILPEGLPAMLAAAEAAAVATCVYPSDGETLPTPQDGDLLVATPSGPSPESLVSRLSSGSVILLLNPSEACVKAIYGAFEATAECKSQATENRGHGLILHGTRLLLAVPRQEMAFVAYTMRFGNT